MWDLLIFKIRDLLGFHLFQFYVSDNKQVYLVQEFWARALLLLFASPSKHCCSGTDLTGCLQSSKSLQTARVLYLVSMQVTFQWQVHSGHFYIPNLFRYTFTYLPFLGVCCVPGTIRCKRYKDMQQLKTVLFSVCPICPNCLAQQVCMFRFTSCNCS